MAAHQRTIDETKNAIRKQLECDATNNLQNYPSNPAYSSANSTDYQNNSVHHHPHHHLPNHHPRSHRHPQDPNPDYCLVNDFPTEAQKWHPYQVSWLRERIKYKKRKKRSRIFFFFLRNMTIFLGFKQPMCGALHEAREIDNEWMARKRASSLRLADDRSFDFIDFCTFVGTHTREHVCVFMRVQNRGKKKKNSSLCEILICVLKYFFFLDATAQSKGGFRVKKFLNFALYFCRMARVPIMRGAC